MKKFLSVLIVCSLFISVFKLNCFASDGSDIQIKEKKVPEGYLSAHVYRSDKEKSGNTLQWEYDASAMYDGTRKVKLIRITVTASASLRNSASISLGFSQTGVSAGVGSSWQTTSTVKCNEETDGMPVVRLNNNIVIGPAKDYRKNTIMITNIATLELDNNVKVYEESVGI